MQLLLHALLAEHDPAKTRIVVFSDIDRPAEISPELYWVRGDPTKESELDKDRMSRAAAVLVAGARGGEADGRSRRAVNSQLLLQTHDGDAIRRTIFESAWAEIERQSVRGSNALVVAVGVPGQDQVHFGAAVGDEDLLAIEVDGSRSVARVRISPKSDPASGSVRSIAPMSSPEAKPGR